ncbi:hypothetical protein EXU48_08950 [Occultella glacieicola]|uniref:Uncharacterized protein n=1 Tax=Occultella glacieicola TaxID=2518684 RepID=A0ABY2E864_9MICO|nr:hypothetical protein [Occultella glacieicola]TDE94902.1 hypothetical protein EXU48_08950 [Occultella glacieicola]
MTDVSIAVDPLGAVTIDPAGRTPPPPWRAGVVDAVGGSLTWPVGSPRTSAPHAVLDDPDAAQQWLWQVYGTQVALAVATLAADPAAGNLAAAAEAGPLTGVAHRLGHVCWAQAWWPASVLDGVPPLDADLLLLERVGLEHEADGLVDDALGPAAASGVARALATLDALNGDLEPQSPESVTVAQARAAALDWAEALEVELTPEPVARAEAFALAAGAVAVPGVELARGRHGATWAGLPAGLVDAAETAVSWSLRRTGTGGELIVEVTGLPGRPPGLTLTAAVLDGMRSAVVLDLRPDENGWRAQAPVPAGTGTDLTVLVSLPGYGRAGPGPEADDRDRVRDAARALLEAPVLLAEGAARAVDEDF